MIREALPLLAAVAVVGTIGAIALHVVRQRNKPKGKTGEYVYHVTRAGVGNDGLPRFVSAISPDFGDVHTFTTLGHGFRSIEEATNAALDAIKALGGVAKEYVPL